MARFTPSEYPEGYIFLPFSTHRIINYYCVNELQTLECPSLSRYTYYNV